MNEQDVSKELARRWGPGVLSRLEKLQTRLQEAQKLPKQTETETAVTPQATGWYDSVKKQAQTYPTLLAVKSTPLVNRMLSTLQAQMEQPVTPVNPEQTHDVICQCSGVPSHACKRLQNQSNEV